MKYFDETLNALQQKLAEKTHLEATRRVLASQEGVLSKKTAELEQIKRSEDADVAKLEGHSLAAFYYHVVGKRDAMLTREREEAYAAQVKYDAARHSLEAVRQELADIDSALRELGDCERQYEKTIAAKRAELAASNNPVMTEILTLETLYANLENQKKELDEAITEGERALSITERILDSLGSAENWGTFDLIGGGLISDLAKHSHLDDAQAQIHQLQDALRRFQTECADAKTKAMLHVNVDGFLRFADFFFDGLFADWAVLGRIQNSQGQVHETRKALNDALSKLRGMKAAAGKEQESVKAKCAELVHAAELG